MGRAKPDPGDEERLRTAIRERIVAGLHTGRLDVGHRLPSYREVANETGADLRAVARAYARLQSEGLVEVRGRSGVYVAPQERIGGKVLAETARWFVAVLREAWSRRIRIPDLPEFVRECTATRVLRCAMVESTVDQMESLAAELRDDFGFDVSPVHAGRFAGRAMDRARMIQELNTLDFIATTVFHVREMREMAGSLKVPLVVVRLNPTYVREVQRALAGGGITVLCVDPLFAERLKLIAGDGPPDRVHAVLASDGDALARLVHSRPLLVSEAARRVVGHMDLPPSFSTQPMISPESADEFAELLVRMNLEAIRAGRD